MSRYGRRQRPSGYPESEPIDLWRDASGDAWSLFDAKATWLFLRRNLKRLALISAVTSGLAFAASFFLFTKYSATSVLIVDPRTAKVTRAGGVISNIGGDAIAIESLVQATKAESFLDELVGELGLARDKAFGGGHGPEAARLAAIEKLAGALTIARRGTTYVIDITATARSAEMSARIANAAAEKLVRDQTALRSGASATTATEIENRLNALRGRLGRAEEAAAQLKARLNVTDAGAGSTLLERRVSELNQQLVQASARTAEARAHYDLLRKAGATTVESLPQSIQSSMLGALRAEYARLSRQSADQSTVLGPRHPEVRSLNAQMADVKRQMAREIDRLVVAARAELLEAEQREADLSRQLKSAETESAELGPQMVKLQELDREAKAERAVYEELLNRQRELLQVKDLEPSDIRIVSRATPPTRPSPERVILIVASLLIGLLAGLEALVRESKRGTLTTLSQARRVAAAEPLGFLPIVEPPQQAARGDASVPDLTPWLSDICSSARPRRGDAPVILISSARRGEGRSTVAVNLAACYGQSGARTLLLQADPSSAAGNPRFGLVDALAAGEGLGAAFTQRRAMRYTLLPYGGRSVAQGRDASALMNGLMLRAAFKVLRKWFDVIVVDGPPALEPAQARALVAQADATIFLVEWDKTKMADVEKALERLDLKQAGIVFNKTDPERLRLYEPEQSRQIDSQMLAA